MSCPEGPALNQGCRRSHQGSPGSRGSLRALRLSGGSMPDGPASFSARLDALEARVRRDSTVVPALGLVLGSGLGGLADEIADATVLPFSEMPGWPAAS